MAKNGFAKIGLAKVGFNRRTTDPQWKERGSQVVGCRVCGDDSRSQTVQPAVPATPGAFVEAGRDLSPVVTLCVPTWVHPPDSPDLGDQDHGLEGVFDNLMDPDEEEENLLRGNSSTVPGVPLQNRFSPLGEAPIVRDPAVFPMTDDAEEELPQSPRRRRPTRRLVLVPLSTGTPQSVQDRVVSPDIVPIGHHHDEEADGCDTVSLFSEKRICGVG